MKEIVLDTETTGISVKEGHRIVEIGCIELENFTNKIPLLSKSRKKSFRKALEIHGYTMTFYLTKNLKK